MTTGGIFANAVEAMLAQSDAMGVISQNISNLNTTGYKSSTENFQTTLSQVSGNTDIFGVKPALTNQTDKQGDIASTGVWNNLAISGAGFFAVSSGTQFLNNAGDVIGSNGEAETNSATGAVIAGTGINATTGVPFDGTATSGALPIDFTRDGNFNTAAAPAIPNATGANSTPSTATYLADMAGGYLLGYAMVPPPAGSTSTNYTYAANTPLTAVNYTVGSGLAGNATSNITVQAVLPAGATGSSSLNTSIYSDTYGAQTLNMNFTPVGTNLWAVGFATPPTAPTATVAATTAATPLTFNSSGSLASTSPPIQVTWANGQQSTLALDLSGLAQAAAPATAATAATASAASVAQDGSATAATTSLSVAGTLGANFTNNASFTQAATVYDALGNQHTLDLNFTETANGSWSVAAAPVEAGATTASTTSTPLNFNAAGQFVSAATPLAITWNGGSQSDILLNLQGMVQSATGTAGATIVQNGIGATTTPPQLPSPTTTLDVSGTVVPGTGSTFSQTTTVYDPAGDPQTLDLTFTSTGANTWNVTASLPPAPAPVLSLPAVGAITSPATNGSAADVTFDSTGSPVVANASNITVDWTGGATSDLTLDLSGLTSPAGATAAITGTTVAGANGTTTIALSGTLPASETDSNQSVTVPVVDSSGATHYLALNLAPDGDGGYTVSPQLQSTVAFDGLGNALPNQAASLQVTWPDQGTSAINVNLGQMTQLDVSGVQTENITQNGYAAGSLMEVDFNSSGQLVGNYSNGKEVPIYQLAVDAFNAPDQLTALSGNLFAENLGSSATNPVQGSGAPIAMTGPDAASDSTYGSTSFVPGALEQSNVDLNDQFTRMIQSQEAYNSAGQVFKIADQMMQTVRDLVAS